MSTSNRHHLVELLKSDKKEARGYAARALRLMGGEQPDLVEPHIGDIAELLNDSHGWARGKAADALGKIGEEYPEKVDPHIDEKDLRLHIT